MAVVVLHVQLRQAPSVWDIPIHLRQPAIIISNNTQLMMIPTFDMTKTGLPIRGAREINVCLTTICCESGNRSADNASILSPS